MSSPRRFTRGAVVLAVAAVLATASPAPEPASATPAAPSAPAAPAAPPVVNAIELGPVQTAYEKAGGHISRDCGYGRQVDNPSASYLMLFCDTARGVPPVMTSIRGSAAASRTFTPGAIPALTDHPTPGGAVLPIPRGARCDWPGESPNILLWAMGIGPSEGKVTRVPYAVVCGKNGSYYPVGWAVADYHADTRRFTNGRLVFSRYAGQQILGAELTMRSMVQSGGHYYFVSKVTPGRPTCTTPNCRQQQDHPTTLARVRKADVGRPRSYQWWSPSGWKDVDRRHQAGTIAAFGPGYGWGPFLQMERVRSLPGSPVVMSAYRFQSGTVEVFTTKTDLSTPGTWTKKLSFRIPRCDGAPGCRAVNPHAQLSTSNALFFTYFASWDNTGGGGHVRAVRVPWPT